MTDANKRTQLINQLLDNPAHATHMANIWKNVMLPDDVTVRRLETGFSSWLYGQFKDNVPYHQMVRTLILANGSANQNGPALFCAPHSSRRAPAR